MTYRIISDSSSNIFNLSGKIDYRTVPLKILVDGVEYVDEPGLDTEALVAKMEASQWGSSTSCPAPQEWLDAFEGADYIFCITITSGLSGSYNSALNARDMYLEKYPDAKIYVVDSLSTGGEMELIIEKIRECMEKELPFEEAVQVIQDYQTHSHLLFTLESLSNLAKNGRVSPTVAKVAGLLGIRFLGRASEEGTLQQAHICRGPKKTLTMSFAEMVKMGYKGGKVRIHHSLNAAAAEKLRNLILAEYPHADVTVTACTGLCSYYAERGGMIFGFEDF
ncbi:MAG: DegV family protein [Solobacterium sp.]|nr:DegV family protein [Solobacterium sp.]